MITFIRPQRKDGKFPTAINYSSGKRLNKLFTLEKLQNQIAVTTYLDGTIVNRSGLLIDRLMNGYVTEIQDEHNHGKYHLFKKVDGELLYNQRIAPSEISLHEKWRPASDTAYADLFTGYR